MWLEKNKELEKKIFSELGVVSSEMLYGGLVNSVYYINLKDGISGVLKITDNQKEDWILKKERAILRRFDDVVFPKLISHGSIDKYGVNYNLVSFLKGDLLSSGKEIYSENIFFELGLLLAEIHSNSEKTFGFIYDFDKVDADPRVHNSYPGPYKNGFEQHYIPAKGWVEHLIEKKSRYSKELEIIISKMEKEKNLFAQKNCTYNHGDYQFKNILTHNNQLTGLLDFDSFRFGDPSSDLHMFLQNCVDQNVSGAVICKFLEGYSRKLPYPDHFFEKAPFYRYYKAIQEVIAIPFYLRNSSPDMVEPYKLKIKNSLHSLIDGSDSILNIKNL